MLSDVLKLYLYPDVNFMYNLCQENGRLTEELSSLRRRQEEQRLTLEDRISELEKQVTELTSDLYRVNSELQDTSANYQLRVQTLETKLKSSNSYLQVT